MYPAPFRRYRNLAPRVSCPLLVGCIAIAVAWLTGCGGTGSTVSGNTSVTVLTSSTANDQLTQFFLSINSVTLTNSTGQTVTLFDTPQYAELMHVNGGAEPLTTATIPQGVYTSATVSVGSAQFDCEAFDPPSGSIISSQFGDQQVPPSNVTSNLPEPIIIAGATMGLLLDLQVSQSANWITCGLYNDGVQPYSITPTLSVTPIAFSSQPTNTANGKFVGLRGLVASVDTNGTGFSVISANIPLWEANPSGPSWQVAASDSTVFQGITGFPQLAVGMPVDMDAAIQQDGSLLATRIAVYDPSAANLSVSTGPLLRVDASEPDLAALDSYAQGYLPGSVGAAPFSFGNAQFQTSGQFTNLPSLPFTANFAASNMVAGQDIFITTHALNTPLNIPATTITLLPQTLNGTVSAIGSDGGFTTYTVTLAPYDVFPALAVQPAQTTLLTSPNTVVVYTDENTQMLNRSPIAEGSVVRFYGLVFNDNGTLRMDCAQVNDGVAE